MGARIECVNGAYRRGPAAVEHDVTSLTPDRSRQPTALPRACHLCHLASVPVPAAPGTTVVLRPASHGPLDQHLKSAFTQREWFAVEHTSPHQALAELCLREKAQTAQEKPNERFN